MGLDSVPSFSRHSPDSERCYTDGRWMVFAYWERIVLFTIPLCDLNTWLAPFWACTCSCSEVACWPEAVTVSGQVKMEKEFLITYSSFSPRNLPLRGSLSGLPTGHIALSRLYFPFPWFCKMLLMVWMQEQGVCFLLASMAEFWAPLGILQKW